jgi:TonB-dependent starch-binding outer membrane protein SusC
VVRSPRVLMAVSVIAATGAAGLAKAQQPLTNTGYSETRAPMFFTAARSTGARVDARNAAVLQKHIGVELMGVPIADALDTIAARSGLELIYSQSLLPAGARVTLVASNITVAGALTVTLLDAGVDVRLTGGARATIVARDAVSRVSSGKREDTELTGRVVDGDTRLGVTAAAVVVTGTTIGTMTSDSGTFVLRVPADARSLTVRRIGYIAQTVILKAGTTDYAVTLIRDVLRLEAEVVTGVATSVSSQNAANDVAVVQSQAVNAVPAPTVENALQGEVPGAVIQTNNSGAPGGGLNIQIRGATSINANASPLYVVDGVIVNNETIYSGTNAITAANPGAGVAPSPEDNGVNRIADLNPDDIETVEVLKGASASAIYGSKASSGVIIITTKRGAAGKPAWRLSQQVGHFSDAQYMGLRTFPTLASAQAWGAPLGYDANKIASVYAGPQDFQGQLYSNPEAAYETDLSVSGTAGGTQYFLSGLSKYDNGIQTNTGYQKNSVRANVTQSLSNAISVSVSMMYAHDLTRRGISGNDNIGIAPYDVFSYTPQFVDLAHENADGTWPVNPFGPANPFADAAEIQTPETVNRFIGGGNISWVPWKTDYQDIRIAFTGGADYTDQRDNLYAPPSLQIEQQGTALPGVATTQDGNVSYTNASLNLIHHYAGLSNVDFTTSVGGEDEHRQVVNPSTVSQNLIAGAVSPAIGTVQTNFFNESAQHDQSLYAQEQVITLAQRLALTAGVTAERTTNDGDIAKFYAYPRYSASYRIPHLASFLDEIKLRAAYGQSGTQPNYGVRYTPLTTLIASGAPGIAPPTTLGDPNIKPESEAEIETGFDATMFRSRAQFSATVYQKRVTDLLLQAGVPWSVGYTNEWLNGGEFTNQGIELSLAATPVTSERGPTWVSTTTFYRNYSVVNSLPVAPFAAGAIPLGGPYGEYWIQTGRSVSEIVNTGMLTSNGTPVQVGDGQPSYVMTFNNNVTFRGFSLSALVEWERGLSVCNATNFYFDYGPLLLADTAQQTKRLQEAFAGLAPYVELASFVNLRQAVASYTLPAQWINSVLAGRITSARLSLTGRNLLHSYAKQFTGLDPEGTFVQGEDVSHNVQITTYPPARSFFLGLDLGF